MKRITASAIIAILAVAMVWAQGPTQFHPGFTSRSRKYKRNNSQEQRPSGAQT